MFHFVRRPWDLPQRMHTSPEVYVNRQTHRRDFLKAMGLGTIAATLATGCNRATDEEIEDAGAAAPLPEEFKSVYPANRNEDFEYGRTETTQRAAAEWTNFYEFTEQKDVWKHVSKFNPVPAEWDVEIDGLVSKPTKLNIDDIYRKLADKFEERALRHRCVETWAMCVPWTGFPLSALLELAEPKPKAKYVAFQTFEDASQANNFSLTEYPWPYREGLTIEEATNILTFMATGIFGEPLPKQHGAPIRLVVPWKYGFKCIKSIVRITLVEKRPPTFWSTKVPEWYGFSANVDPDEVIPWPQDQEYMLETRERFATVPLNGYGDWIGKLYA